MNPRSTNRFPGSRRCGRVTIACLTGVFCLVAAPWRTVDAEVAESARVTQIIKDVRLMAGNAGGRPAVLSDHIVAGKGVRTGADSRAELTFTDLSITRLGANTVFSFNSAQRTIDLSSGAILVEEPPGAAPIHISTQAFTAGVSGGTGMIEFHKGAVSKFMILEGQGTIAPAGHPNDVTVVPAGEMVALTPDGGLTKPQKFNVALVVKTSQLINGFPALANLPLIVDVIAQQGGDQSYTGGPNNYKDPTGLDIITVDPSPPSPSPTPGGGGGGGGSGKFGPLPTITSPDPYVIGSGTQINTDPMITTNGVTDFGKIYRGPALDGSEFDYLFGSTNSFDATIMDFFNTNGNGVPVAVFKFSHLELTGDPTITIPSGATTFLGLVSVGDVTSGAPGGTLTGLDRLFIATVGGSIDLGSEISFSGIGHVTFYARGTGSNLTLGSAISGADVVHLDSQGTVQINGNISATTEFRSFSGGDFLTGTGTVTTTNIDIESLSNITFDANKFQAPSGGAGGIVNFNAADTLTIIARSGAGMGSHPDSLTAQANTINLNSSGLNTVDIPNVSFTAGSGGIQAPNALFENNTSVLLQTTNGGDININGTQNDMADSPNGATVIASGAFTAQAGVSLNGIQAGTSITVGNDLLAGDFEGVSAGTTINVGGVFSSKVVSAGGDITANQIEILTLTAPNGVLTAGSGGITAFLFVGPHASYGAERQYTFAVDSIVSSGGIDFSGNQFNGLNGLSHGGLLTINANTLTFDSATGIASANFNGADAGAFSGGGPSEGGDGGVFIVNTTGDITANNGSDIMATTGLNTAAGVYSGAGGSVTLHSTGGMVTVNNTIQVSSDDSAAPRQSASGGTILLRSDLTTGQGITVGANAQLLSLLNANAPGPGGSITLSTMGSNITVTSGATITADRGTITMDQNDPPGQIPTITIDGATLTSQAVHITAAGDLDIGMNSPVTINTGSISLAVAHNLNLGDLTLSGLAGAAGASSNISLMSDGGALTLNASAVNIGSPGNILGSVAMNGGDAVGGATPGSGGTFNVNTAGNITVDSDIEATSGHQDASAQPAGSGGSVSLNSTSGEVSVTSRIEVSSDDPTPSQTPPPPIRRSAQGGNITLTSGAASGTAIQVSNSAQLLALLDAAAPGPGGVITVKATGISSSVNVQGTVEADRGTIDVEQTGDNGNITLGTSGGGVSTLMMRADTIKVGALGMNGTLLIGNSTLSADTLISLYAGGSNGSIEFNGDVTLDNAMAKIIAASVVTIDNGVTVTITGAAASVYTDNARYAANDANGNAEGGIGGSFTGRFAGSGASTHPFVQAPSFPPSSAASAAVNASTAAATLASQSKGRTPAFTRIAVPH